MKVSKALVLTLLVAFSAAPALAAATPIAEIQMVDHRPWHDDGPQWQGNNGPHWQQGQGQGQWQQGQGKWQKQKWSDCHRSPDRHFVKGYGKVLHRHVGPNCRVQLVKQYKQRQNNNCIRLGDFWICP